MSLVDILSAVPAFQKLAPDDFEAFASAFTTRSHASGFVLIHEGKKADNVYLLLDGELKVHRQRGAKRVELNRLKPGAWVGLVALIDAGPRSATVETATTCRVATLPLSALQLLMSSQAPLAIALFAALGSQLAGDFRNVDRRSRAMLA
jgi:CRP/FNR family transcriptional regulator, cyclic AMP receptor protein